MLSDSKLFSLSPWERGRVRASGRTILTTKTKKPAERAFLLLKWLGCRDSNPGMLVSETRALPLGDTPISLNKLLNDFLNWLGYEDSNLGMPESESGALPLGDTPTILSGFIEMNQ